MLTPTLGVLTTIVKAFSNSLYGSTSSYNVSLSRERRQSTNLRSCRIIDNYLPAGFFLSCFGFFDFLSFFWLLFPLPMTCSPAKCAVVDSVRGLL